MRCDFCNVIQITLEKPKIRKTFLFPYLDYLHIQRNVRRVTINYLYKRLAYLLLCEILDLCAL